ncbi:MAG: hypothetical protein KGL90_11175 [Burkholderiales bacterium]|nr:hypothetical protein [Burkholderiales bacterium]
MQRSTRLTRIGWHLLLALVLLLMQQASLRHALQHAARDDGHPAHSTLCKQCLAHAATDALAFSTPPVMALLQAHGVPLADHQEAQRHDSPQAGYQTRAPPRLSVQA